MLEQSLKLETAVSNSMREELMILREASTSTVTRAVEGVKHLGKITTTKTETTAGLKKKKTQRNVVSAVKSNSNASKKVAVEIMVSAEKHAQIIPSASPSKKSHHRVQQDPLDTKVEREDERLKEDDWYDHDPTTSTPIDELFFKMSSLSSLDTPGERMSPVKLGRSQASLSMELVHPTTPSSSRHDPPIMTPSSLRTPPLLQSARHSIFSAQDPLDIPSREEQLMWNTPSRQLVNSAKSARSPRSHRFAAESRTPAARRDWGKRDGTHWWVGCGCMKSKIERMATKVSKLRGIAMRRNLEVPPHPEIWIAEKKPSQAELDADPKTRVNDEEAQNNGCSLCRWEAQQYVIIEQMCRDVLEKKLNVDQSEWY
jgi:hypothetical protein